jgi:phosphoenolpyruvate carboxykinase (ATP)
MRLVSNHPGKVKFMQYNTGGIGEIIETLEEGGQKKKRLVRKVKRVPINLMAQIQRGDLRGTNRYEKGRLGTKEIVSCEGRGLEECDIANYYTQDQISGYIKDLVEGRRQFTQEIASEGLREEILAAAERSFRIDKAEEKSRIEVPAKQFSEADEKREEFPPLSWDTKSRPRRDRFFRLK